MTRYAVKADVEDGYDGHVPVLYLVCEECRDNELLRRAFLYVGPMTDPEMGCLEVFSVDAPLERVNELAAEHDRQKHPTSS